MRTDGGGSSEDMEVDAAVEPVMKVKGEAHTPRQPTQKAVICKLLDELRKAVMDNLEQLREESFQSTGCHGE